jgi:hypothetical protein
MALRNHGSRIPAWLFVVVFIFSGCVKNLTNTTVVYENNFENQNPQNLTTFVWNASGTAVISLPNGRFSKYNGSMVMGRFNNARVDLILPALPSHTVLRVEMDLYIHDDWKTDLWMLGLNSAVYFMTSFSNDSTLKQSYPNWPNNAADFGPAGRNAEVTHLPSPCNPTVLQPGTSKYRIIKTLAHTDPSVQFYFTDAGNFLNDTCKRSWSIDNLKVSVFNN